MLTKFYNRIIHNKMDQKIFLSINSKPFDFNIETLSIDQSLLENMQSCSSKWKLEIDEIDTS